MKTIGIIGGMSAESTALYYRRLNEEARRRLGEANVEAPVFDTTLIHADAALEAALAG